jgi:hypothetical protein
MTVRRLLPLFFFLLTAAAVHAQFQRGTILGTVTDATGAVVSGAKITLVNINTNEERTSVSSGRGDYEFLLILPGNYRLSAESSGFKTQVVSDIKLDVNQTARLDVKLEVGEVAQRIETTASTRLLQTETSEIGGVVTNKQIVDLPLNGRDYLQLARLLPGAIPSRAGATAGAKGVSRSVNVAGARDTSVSFLLDGIDTNDVVFQDSERHPFGRCDSGIQAAGQCVQRRVRTRVDAGDRRAEVGYEQDSQHAI